MYKRLGISNADIALYTSWLYLPWVIKPFWSPIVDLIKTKRWWIVIMQLFIGAGLAGIAFTIPAPGFLQYTLAFFWLMAFSSATHDIAADGFYMLGLDEHKQAFFVGIRSTFYRLAMITGQGILIILAGSLESKTGLEPLRFEVSSSSSQKITDWDRNPEEFAKESGDQRFMLSSEEIKISTEKLSLDQSNEIKSWAKSQNEQNHFTETDQPQNTESPSWWAQTVSGPLKIRLKEIWGKDDSNDQTRDKLVGNISLTGIRLSSPPEPGETVVLNLGEIWR